MLRGGGVPELCMEPSGPHVPCGWPASRGCEGSAQLFRAAGLSDPDDLTGGTAPGGPADVRCPGGSAGRNVELPAQGAIQGDHAAVELERDAAAVI